MGKKSVHNLLLQFAYTSSPTDGVVRRMVWRHLVLLVTGVGLLMARWVVMGSTVPRFMKVDNPASFLDSVMFRVSWWHCSLQHTMGWHGSIFVMTHFYETWPQVDFL